jgi:ABC-type bacteriocin/lantibiotic exporter with double-glycine peptidase domain
MDKVVDFLSKAAIGFFVILLFAVCVAGVAWVAYQGPVFFAVIATVAVSLIGYIVGCTVLDWVEEFIADYGEGE